MADERVNITIKLEPNNHKVLKLICAVKGITITDYVSRLIENEVSKVDEATLTQMEKLKEL